MASIVSIHSFCGGTGTSYTTATFAAVVAQPLRAAAAGGLHQAVGHDEEGGRG